MKPLANIYYYIDPKIKNYDKEIYQNFELFVNQEKYQQATSDEMEHEVMIVFITKMPLTPKAYHLYIKYEQANLDLFSEREGNKTDAFIVEEVSDFRGNQETISLLVKKLQNSFISEFLRKNEQELDKSISKIKKSISINEQYEILNFTSQLYLSRPNTLQDFLSLDSAQSLQESLGVYFYEVKEKKKHPQFIVYVGENQLLEIDCVNSSHSYLVYLILGEYFEQIDLIQKKRFEWDELKMLLNSLQSPLCLLGNNNEIMYINSAMSDLALSQKIVNELEHEHFIEQSETVFQVEKHHLGENDTLIILNRSLEGHEPTSAELGIISSSIAHELNNPLGGLLASIDVLLLEDLDSEFIDRLVEMKKVVLRCKKLVETFLGFSRSEVNLKKWEGFDLLVKDSIQQANELIRFRLVESQLHMNLEFKKIEKYQYPFNPHILSMIFYLIFGELLTSFSHYTLIETDKNSLFSIEVGEHKGMIEILFEKKMKLNQSFFRSRLFKHLLEVESLKLQVESGCLKIIYK